VCLVSERPRPIPTTVLPKERTSLRTAGSVFLKIRRAFGSTRKTALRLFTKSVVELTLWLQQAPSLERVFMQNWCVQPTGDDEEEQLRGLVASGPESPAVHGDEEAMELAAGMVVEDEGEEAAEQAAAWVHGPGSAEPSLIEHAARRAGEGFGAGGRFAASLWTYVVTALSTAMFGSRPEGAGDAPRPGDIEQGRPSSGVASAQSVSFPRLAQLLVVSDAQSWQKHPDSDALSQHAHATASAMVVCATPSLGVYGKDGSSGEMQAHLKNEVEKTIKFGATFKPVHGGA
jgi:hypothetical protein